MTVSLGHYKTIYMYVCVCMCIYIYMYIYSHTYNIVENPKSVDKQRGDKNDLKSHYQVTTTVKISIYIYF